MLTLYRVVCGTPDFARRMRDAALKEMSRENVTEFLEAEYRPVATSRHVTEPRSIELINVPSAVSRSPARPVVISKPALSHISHSGDIEYTRKVGVREYV